MVSFNDMDGSSKPKANSEQPTSIWQSKDLPPEMQQLELRDQLKRKLRETHGEEWWAENERYLDAE